MDFLRKELLNKLSFVHPFWLLDTRDERFRKYPLRTVWNGITRRFFYKFISLGIISDVPKLVKIFSGEYLAVPHRQVFYLKKGFFEGEELRLTRFIVRTLKPGSVFIDGGAYFGWYSVLAAKLVSRERNGQVHSFEPTPRSFEMLEKNAKLYPNITINRKALWNSDGKMNFNDLGPEEEGSNTLLNDPLHVSRYDNLVAGNKNRTTITIETIKLDTYCKLQNIRPSFIKLDCEGAEYEILLGAKKIISASLPIIATEIQPIAFENDDFEKIEKFLNAFGYKAYILDDGGEPIRWKNSFLKSRAKKLHNFIFAPDK